MNIKGILQNAAAALGYRIVPNNRDCASSYRWLRSIPFKTIVDVGAHNGATVSKWLEDFPSAFVHAFEPLPSAFKALEQVAAASSGRAKAWNYAASDSSGTMKFFEHTDHLSSSSAFRATDVSKSVLSFTRNEREIVVPSATLDQLLFEQHAGMETPMLVKLDVQGMEAAVVRGSPRLFDMARVVLAEVSVIPLYEGQCTFADLYTLLGQHGFDYRGVVEQFHLSDGTPVYFDALFTKKN